MWTREPSKMLIFNIDKHKPLAGATNLEQLQLDFQREESPLFKTLLGTLGVQSSKPSIYHGSGHQKNSVAVFYHVLTKPRDL